MKRLFLFSLLIIFFDVNAQEASSGPFKYFYPNGLLQQEGIRTSTSNEGTIYHYDEQKKLIKKVEYNLKYPRKGNFEGYSYTEKVSSFLPDGSVISIHEYENGKDVTKTLNNYPNGQLRSEVIPDQDKIHFINIAYYENGRIQSRNIYIEEGKKKVYDGIQEYFYPDGTKKSMSTLKRGVKEGPTFSWSEKGILLDEFRYHNDTAVYIERFNKIGKPTSFWSKDSPVEMHFSKNYYPGDSILQGQTYRKKVMVDSLEIIVKIDEKYDAKGQRNYIHVSENDESNRRIIYYGTEALVGLNLIATESFRLERVAQYKDTVFKLHAGYRVEQQGFYIRNDIKFAANGSANDHHKFIEDQLAEVKKNVHDGKVNETHRVPDEAFEQAQAYYEIFPNSLFYKQSVLRSDLDSNLNGNFRIDYLGTEMYFTGTLKNGFLNGKAVLHLNDKVMLFERHFNMGIEDGLSKSWFVDGALCNEQQFQMGRVRERNNYYTNGQLWKKEVFDEKNTEIGKEIWTRDGKLLEFLVKTDSLNQSFSFNKDGTFNNYRWVDVRNNISLGKTLYKERFSGTITIPHIGGQDVTFRIDRAGVVIEGKAYWDPVEQKSVLVDNYGELAQFDRTVISYPDELPCKCQGWEAYEFFAQSTAEFVDEKVFSRYQFNFHQPITNLDHVFGNPYYINTKPDEYKMGQWYTTYSNHFVAKPMVLYLPDTNGVQLVLEPCKSRFAFIKYQVSTEFVVGSFKETKAAISDMKHIGLQLPEKIMTQVDPQFKPLISTNGKPYPGMFMFSTKKIQYDLLKEINVTYPNFIHGRYMQLGSSGIILDAAAVYPDFSSTENYPAMNTLWNSSTKKIDSVLVELKFPKKDIEQFTGAFIESAALFIPLGNNSEKVQCSTGILLISATTVVGEINIPATLSSENNYSIQLKNGGTQTVSKEQLAKNLQKTGAQFTQLVYDRSSKSFKTFIHYKP